MGNYTIFWMFENPRKDKQAINFTTKVPKILDLKSFSEQIFSRKLSLGAPNILSSFPSPPRSTVRAKLVHMIHVFPALSSCEQTQRNEVEAPVDNFIQITVFCRHKPRIDAFIYRNVEKVYQPG